MASRNVPLAAFILAVWSGFYSRHALAWNYSEHGQITYDALTGACQELTPQLGPVATKLCAHKEAMRCFAHMVAVAADHVGTPQELAALMKPGSGYMYGAGLNCLDILSASTIPTDTCHESLRRSRVQPHTTAAGVQRVQAGSTEFDCQLVPPFIIHWLRYATLAATNDQHFPYNSDDAWQCWVERTDTSNDGDRPPCARAADESGNGTNLMLVRAAFALHFFEDSFPSGHIGLDRSDRRQDYGSAYHDDLNAVGRFVRDGAGRVWYTYGDSHLMGYRVEYFPLSQLTNAASDDERKGLLADLVEQVHGVALTGDATLRDIQQVARDDSGTDAEYVLSLPRAGDRFYSPCFVFDDCDKQQIILYRDTPGQGQPSGCVCERHLTSTLWVCDGQMLDPVMIGTTLAAEVVLLRLDNPVDPQQRIVAAQATSYLPVDYRNISKALRSGINKSPIVMRYGQWQPIKKPFALLPAREWGLTVDRTTDTVFGAGRSELGFTLRLSDLFHSIKDRVSAVATGPSPEADSAAGGSPMLALQTRYGLIDTEGHVLDSFRISGYCDCNRFKFTYRIFGVSPLAAAGIDSVWDGVKRRNYYGGVGLSFDAHVAKQSLYVDFVQEWHHNGTFGTWPLIRAVVGVRVMSINLDGTE